MKALKSYAYGEWFEGAGEGRSVHNAVTGAEIASVDSGGLDFKRMLDHAREAGGPALRGLTFPRRGELLRSAAGVIQENLPELYEIAYTYGATKADAWMDIEGGLGTLLVFSGLGRKQMPDSTFLVDGEIEGLSKEGTFVGRHVRVSPEGAAVHINAFNFPAWNMLEKLAPALLAGLPSIVKPATPTCPLAHRIVELLVESAVLPEGGLQMICGGAGDLLDHLTCQDVVCFTGSADTAEVIRSHPNIVRNSVRVNIEADSLNCAILGPDCETGAAVFNLFVKEVAHEMTQKAGQKCTAIRRVIVPESLEASVIDALRGRLAKTVIGDPSAEGVRMGPLVSRAQVDAARAGLAELAKEAEIVFGDPEGFEVTGADRDKGAFFPPVLLHCKDPAAAEAVHRVEVFGPVATVMGYGDAGGAVRLARKGGGSLAASVFSEDEGFVREVAFGMAPYHGRLLVMNEAASKESTRHGTVMPQMVHGGPGRAGGGEELGGLRGVHRFMLRVALQGSPERLEALCTG